MTPRACARAIDAASRRPSSSAASIESVAPLSSRSEERHHDEGPVGRLPGVEEGHEAVLGAEAPEEAPLAREAESRAGVGALHDLDRDDASVGRSTAEDDAHAARAERPLDRVLAELPHRRFTTASRRAMAGESFT
jgi:hypothetical protein